MPPADLIPPPTRVKDKVPPTGGPDPRAAILRAIGAAQGLVQDYQGWAVDDLESLWRAFRDARDKSAAARQKDIVRMFDIAHEIRGQGGTFGFPLISVVGDSLCKFLDGRRTLSPAALEVVELHILAMKAVFRQGLKGDGGTLIKELPLLLHALCRRVDPALQFDA